MLYYASDRLSDLFPGRHFTLDGRHVEIKLTQRARFAIRHQHDHLIALHRPKGQVGIYVLNSASHFRARKPSVVLYPTSDYAINFPRNRDQRCATPQVNLPLPNASTDRLLGLVTDGQREANKQLPEPRPIRSGTKGVTQKV